ncbi:MAG: LytTR family DNA-binding domain-containing protein [Pacificimonas sp.]
MAARFVTVRLSRSRTRQIVVGIGISFGVGIILALLGPFGTFTAVGIGTRLVYWVGLMTGGYLVYAPPTMMGMALARSLNLPVIAVIAACGLLCSLPMTWIVWITNDLVSGINDGPASTPTVEQFFGLYGYVAVIGVVMTSLLWWSAARYELPDEGEDETHARAAVPETTPSTPASTPALIQRLPIGHDGIIHALESEDHYVRVHGDGRGDLILMRLADAISEMGKVEGLQTHRGWWVARSAVEKIEKDGRTAVITLTSGQAVPVSRGNMAKLTAAGWM